MPKRYIKVEHLHIPDLSIYSGILSPIRRRYIKFYHRIVRMADRYNLTIDEMYSIYIHYWSSMSPKNFWQLFINNGNLFNPNFRDKIINEIMEARQ
jgi:hypothetical protein